MTNIKCIILIQKRVIRLIQIDTLDQWDHAHNLFYNYRILKFTDIVELRTILFMFDAYHNVLPNDLQLQLYERKCPYKYESNGHTCTRREIVELTKCIAC